jgi:hypothetical protein
MTRIGRATMIAVVLKACGYSVACSAVGFPIIASLHLLLTDSSGAVLGLSILSAGVAAIVILAIRKRSDYNSVLDCFFWDRTSRWCYAILICGTVWALVVRFEERRLERRQVELEVSAIEESLGASQRATLIIERDVRNLLGATRQDRSALAVDSYSGGGELAAALFPRIENARNKA